MATASISCIRPARRADSSEPSRAERNELADIARQPWTLHAGRVPLLVRPSSARDIAAVAHMLSRCSARSLLDRYHCGGRPPAVAALDAALRNPLSFVAVRPDGAVVASGTVARDRTHHRQCAEIGIIVEDRWQRLGIGAELVSHLGGVAQVAGFTELIAYPATAIPAAQRLMVEVGRTRMVPTGSSHLHTYLTEAAALGLGSVRRRLAG